MCWSDVEETSSVHNIFVEKTFKSWDLSPENGYSVFHRKLGI
jgi:hypothetical protein